MGTHETINVIVILSKLIQQADCNSTLSEIAMDNQLGDPTHSYSIVSPSTGKRVAGKAVFDGNFNVKAGGTIG